MNPPQNNGSAGLGEIQFDLAMMDEFPAMVWGVRLDGSVCYFSKAALAFSGQTSVGEAGADWYERVHPEDRERCFAAMHAAFAQRTPFELQFRMRRHDGEYRRVVDRGAPMRNAAGEVAGYLGVAHDVSEQYTADELRRESARLARILEATTDFVGMTTVEGQVLFINAAGRKMIGVGADEPLLPNISTYHSEWANEIVLKEGMPAAISEGCWTGETALLTRDGRQFKRTITPGSNRMDSIELQSTQTQIIEYLRKVCGGSPQGKDSLAMIGIDSVAMAELTFELEKRFAIKIDDDILDVDSVDELVQYVVSRKTATSK